MGEQHQQRAEGLKLVPSRGALRALLALALPVVVVQVGLMAMGVADTIMVGHLSARALAAQGVHMAPDPLVAQAVGAGDRPAVARALQRGLVLAGMLSLPTALLLLTAAPVLRGFGQPLDVVPLAAAYAVRMIPGVPSFFAFVVCRQTLQAMARLRPIVVVIVLANLTNVALNWVMIYGHLGLPTMGVIGSAWSTTISRVLMGFAIVGLAWPELGPSLLPVRPGVFAWPPLRRMLGIGVPIGLQYQLEYGVFATVALLMGRLGTVPVAAHQVAINLASLTFMVPLGVSAAATVLVGHAVGRADAREASRAARAALATGVAFMCATALLMLALPEPLARAYSRDPAVIALAASLLPIAGAFQIFDGIQVVSIGILRGLADTRGPFVIGLLGFWLLGFPVSLWLGFGVHRGPAGLWWGLVVGLAAVAMLLLARVRARLRRGVRRVLVDAPEAA